MSLSGPLSRLHCGVNTIRATLIYFAIIFSPALLAQDYLALFDEICDTVEAHFYAPEKINTVFRQNRAAQRSEMSGINDADVFARTVNELLSTLKTSHTHLYTPNDPEYYQLAAIFGRLPYIRELFGDQEIRYPSIGALLQKQGDRIFVRSVLAESPADSAGILMGDEILAIDDKPYSGISSFAGKIGIATTIKLLREHNSSPILIEIIPKLINPKQEFFEAQVASIRILEREGKRLGYIHIWSYAGREYQEALVDAISFGALKDADGLIWDLRDGWGGAMPSYLNIFNSKVPVYTRVDRDGQKAPWDTQWRKPVVMLVNDGVRSGKEILAYGFKKHKLGPIVGERTAGAVTAGRLFVLSNKSLLYLATSAAEIDGEILEGIGVTPDVYAPMNIPYAAGVDKQLEIAILTLVDLL